ncbi:MAG: CBS domain-containing protein [Deltaproteobacteria bacterium]|nr:CBS domain-containing protein [Deltaproteobacteria bacterium]
MQESLVSRQARHLESIHEDFLQRQKSALLRKCRRIAVVGPSPDANSKSYLSVEKFLGLGLEVIPVLPGCQDYLGLPCYDRLRDVPGDVDIVQVYPWDGWSLPAVAREAVGKGARLFWVEEGRAGPEIKEILAAGGVMLVEDESLEQEYAKHFLVAFADQTAAARQKKPVTVREFMTAHPVTVKPADSLKEALEKMDRGQFRHLPVVDDDGKLAGMVSDRDIRLIHPSPLFVRPEHVAGQLFMIKVRQAAILNPISIGPSASLEQAAKLMLRWRVGALPVVGDGGVLVGIITCADFLRAFLERDKER